MIFNLPDAGYLKADVKRAAAANFAGKNLRAATHLERLLKSITMW